MLSRYSEDPNGRPNCSLYRVKCKKITERDLISSKADFK